jgi:hypothetical protein
MRIEYLAPADPHRLGDETWRVLGARSVPANHDSASAFVLKQGLQTIFCTPARLPAKHNPVAPKVATGHPRWPPAIAGGHIAAARSANTCSRRCRSFDRGAKCSVDRQFRAKVQLRTPTAIMSVRAFATFRIWRGKAQDLTAMRRAERQSLRLSRPLGFHCSMAPATLYYISLIIIKLASSPKRAYRPTPTEPVVRGKR